MLYNFIIKNAIIIILMLSLITLIFLIEIKEYKYKKNGITPQEAIKLLNNNNAIIIDFRPETEFNKVHIINSINIPLKHIDLKKNIIIKYKKKILIIIEDKKYNYANISKILIKNECKNILYLANGMTSWINSDLPSYKKE